MFEWKKIKIRKIFLLKKYYFQIFNFIFFKEHNKKKKKIR